MDGRERFESGTQTPTVQQLAARDVALMLRRVRTMCIREWRAEAEERVVELERLTREKRR